jgi:hypothetical protein
VCRSSGHFYVGNVLGVVVVSVADDLIFCSGVCCGCPFVAGCCYLLLIGSGATWWATGSHILIEVYIVVHCVVVF